MTKALLALFVGALLILLAFVAAWSAPTAPTWGVWAMILGSALTMAAATAMGAGNSHVPRAGVRFVAVFLFVVITAGFGVPLLLPAEVADSPLILGLPLRAAIEIYGVGLLPIVVLPLMFARYFRSAGLDEKALAELRRKCAELRAP